MYRHPSRKKELIRRIAVYAVMSASVLAIVAALLLMVQGYRLNREDGRIEQGGLLQFDSRPAGAAVTINGVQIGARTAAKTSVNAGQHAVTMVRDGYKTWQKTVEVLPGSVVWLNYARLIPTVLAPEHVADMPAVSASLRSPDSRRLLVKEEPSTPVLTLFDLSRAQPERRTLELPATSFTAPAEGATQRFMFHAWDSSSRFVLVKHIYDDAALEWLLVDTQNSMQIKNLTKLLGVAMSEVVFHGDDNNVLFVQTGDTVRRVNVSAATMSGPIVSGVESFRVYEQTFLTYVTKQDEAGSRSVGYYKDGADAPQTVRTISDDGKPQLHLALAKYFNEQYIAITHGETVEILKGPLPENNHPSSLKEVARLTQPGGVATIETRNHGRFIVMQTGARLHIYDVELQKSSITTLKGDATNARTVRWIDDYMFWSALDGKLRLYEFDGANQSEIMTIVPDQEVVVSQDNAFLYAVTKVDAKYHLTRVRLLPN
jgi:hypothetical protein